MSANRFTRNLSDNTLQLVINQVFGLLIFFALSKGLNKNEFGQLNWCLAVLLALFGILSFGIDQVIVKKIAAGYNRQTVFTAYLFHVLVSGGIAYALLAFIYLLAPKSIPYLSVLLILGTGKLAIFFSSPLKQLATGLEQFRSLLLMSVGSNIVRGIALLLFFLFHSLSITAVLIVFIGGDLFELILCAIIARPMLGASYKIKRNSHIYWLLLKESLPQTGVVVFTAIMSRLDWILVGLLVSSAKLAEYSFAWKAFEISTLPLLVIAPIMIPMFTRIYQSAATVDNLSFFVEWQIIMAGFIALLLNLTWTPVIDFITGGKYGAVNRSTIFLLSLAMPILYLNNYLWTILFARGQLNRIFFVMAISFAVNIIGCCVFISLFKNEGAAAAYLLTLLVQLALYLQHESLLSSRRWYFLFRWPLAAALTWLLAKAISTGPITSGLIATILYAGLVFASRQLRHRDWKTLQSFYQ